MKKVILKEGHKSRLSLHPGMTKMYQDLKEAFWWQGMKKDVAQFVSACLTYQKAKVEHQRPGGIMQPLEILVWKWDRNFMIGWLCMSKVCVGRNPMTLVVGLMVVPHHTDIIPLALLGGFHGGALVI